MLYELKSISILFDTAQLVAVLKYYTIPISTLFKHSFQPTLL